MVPSSENFIINDKLSKPIIPENHNVLLTVEDFAELKRASIIENKSKSPGDTNRRDSILTGIHSGLEKDQKEVDIFDAFDYPLTPWKQKLENFLASWIFQLLIGLFTLWALFADDFRIIFVPKDPGDVVFDVINLIVMTSFMIEVVIASITRRKYFGSFFFFMDLISTLIIIFDLTWVQEDLMYVYFLDYYS